MNFLKKLVKARWFPTVTKPILSGLVASGAVVGLRALGITDVVPTEVNEAVAPLVGFLIAAIAQKDNSGPSVGTMKLQATAAVHTATYKPGPTLGSTIAETFLSDIAKEIDEDPALLKGLAAKAFERVLNPTATVAADPWPAIKAITQEVVATGNEAHTN